MDDQLGKIREALTTRLDDIQGRDGLGSALGQAGENQISLVDSTTQNRNVNDANLEDQVSAYEALHKANEMGNAEAKAVFSAMDTFLGKDAPTEQKVALAEWLNERDNELTPNNIMTMTVRGVRDLGLKGNPGGDSPSAVREYQFYNSLPPEEKAQYLQVKRSEKFLNLGGTQRQVGLPEGVEGESYLVTPKPENMPDFKESQARSTAVGKELGEKDALLNTMEANMPSLLKTVTDLSALGKTATYTVAGQGANAAKRQLGMEVGQGGEDRAAYISRVDNEVLPLLRQTFGAQFTKAEGDSLKVTLGDPNKSPKEKDAVLRSFIDAKMKQISSLKRETGKTEIVPLEDINSQEAKIQKALDLGYTMDEIMNHLGNAPIGK